MATRSKADLMSEADRAVRRLRLGIRKSKALAAQYRAKLLAMRDAPPAPLAEPPLFRWDRRR